MTPSNNELFLQMLRDFRAESAEQHREMVSEVKDLKRSLDGRLDAVEGRLLQHDHYFATFKTVAKWVVPSGGVAAIVAAILSFLGVSGSQAK